MKLITSVKLEQADHTQVIDTAATQVGRAANKAFLFVINKEIQGWKNLTLVCSWGLSRLGDKHGPIFDEVKGSAIAVYHKGCRQETAFVQGLIRTQLTDRLDAHWKLHDEAIAWFKAQTQAFLGENPVEDIAEVESEEQAPEITEEPAPVVEVEEPVSEVEESPVVVLDPPVDPDPLDDEMMIPEDPTPVQASTGGKRRTTRKKVESSLSDMMRKEAAKSALFISRLQI